MPQETNLNVSPYFDDFNEDKNFNRVLFKPGIPVQARELTQLQTILQNQIEKFGQHFFKDCLLYTSDAADERSSVDLGGRRIIKNVSCKVITRFTILYI